MIDLRLLRDDPTSARASQRARGDDETLVDAVLAADERRRSSLAEYERSRAEQNKLSKEIAGASPEDRQHLKSHAKQLAEQVKSLKADADVAAAELEGLLARIDNIVQAQTPAGGEDDYVVLREVGTPRDFESDGFVPRDHVELGELHKAIAIDRGA